MSTEQRYTEAGLKPPKHDRPVSEDINPSRPTPTDALKRARTSAKRSTTKTAKRSTTRQAPRESAPAPTTTSQEA